MIQLHDKGIFNAEIGRRLGLARQTVSTVMKSKDKVLEEIKSATPVNTTMIRKRDSLIAEMEKVLVVWIEDQTSHNIPLSQNIIQTKGLTLFNAMKATRGEVAKDEKFEASRGWFMRFKDRSQLHNIKVQGEAASSDKEAAERYPAELAAIIEEGNYSKQQIFNVDETALFWKKLPARTFISKEEKTMPGFKASKDRLTLLLGANAAGDCKLKPMLIYHSQNPRALKNYAKVSLPVYYQWNKKAWMTADLFTKWFTEYFKPTVEVFCIEQKIPFNILLLSDNAPGHPRVIMEMYKEIKVIFLPPNTTSILQPMDQGVISTFKSYYLRRTFSKAIKAIDSAADPNGPRKNKLKAFWKAFNILDAIKNIRDSWNEVKVSTLQGVWKKLLPTLMDDFEGFENVGLEENVAEEVVDMARELELEVELEDVTELLASHDTPLSDEDLLLIDEQRKLLLEAEAADGDEDTDVIPEMSTKDIEHYLNLLNTVVQGFERIDNNFERSSKFGRSLKNCAACYTEILRERKKISLKQTSLTSYFSPIQSTPIRQRSSPTSTPSTSTHDSPPPPSKRIRYVDVSDDETPGSPSASVE